MTLRRVTSLLRRILAAGILAAGILAAGILVAGILATGILVAGILVAGILVAGILAAGILAAFAVFGAPVTVVVVLVGPPLSLAAAVTRVVGHRLYSWFCGVRAVSLCWGGFAGGGVGVDRTTSAKLSGVQVR